MQELTFSQFVKRFHNDTACLEEIRKIRYPEGIFCTNCNRITKHYRIINRPAYGCILCRKHTYPLVTTVFEKSSTPLRLWFYAIFLMTHTRGTISSIQLQKELGVTYKTAWRIKKRVSEQLFDIDDLYLVTKDNHTTPLSKVHKWVFFKHFEIAVIEKDEESLGDS